MRAYSVLLLCECFDLLYSNLHICYLQIIYTCISNELYIIYIYIYIYYLYIVMGSPYLSNTVLIILGCIYDPR